MGSNKFIVDLDELSLNEEQITKINNAIQKAIMHELAAVKFNTNVALIPIRQLPKGPIANGIIAIKLDKEKLESFIRSANGLNAFGLN